MRFYRSWFGYALAMAYVVVAVYVINNALQATGGWLRGLDVAIATLPSQLTFGFLFEALGWRVNYLDLGPMAYAQIVFHVLATALLCYLVGYGIERLARHFFAPARANAQTPPTTR